MKRAHFVVNSHKTIVQPNDECQQLLACSIIIYTGEIIKVAPQTKSTSVMLTKFIIEN